MEVGCQTLTSIETYPVNDARLEDLICLEEAPCINCPQITEQACTNMYI